MGRQELCPVFKHAHFHEISTVILPLPMRRTVKNNLAFHYGWLRLLVYGDAHQKDEGKRVGEGKKKVQVCWFKRQKRRTDMMWEDEDK